MPDTSAEIVIWIGGIFGGGAAILWIAKRMLPKSVRDMPKNIEAQRQALDTHIRAEEIMLTSMMESQEALSRNFRLLIRTGVFYLQEYSKTPLPDFLEEFTDLGQQNKHDQS